MLLPFIFLFCRTITFHNEGHCIFSGSHDSLKVHTWEPPTIRDNLLMGWGKIKDISIASTQLVSYLEIKPYMCTGNNFHFLDWGCLLNVQCVFVRGWLETSATFYVSNIASNDCGPYWFTKEWWVQAWSSHETFICQRSEWNQRKVMKGYSACSVA